MSNVGFIVEEINNERDAVFQCPMCGTEITLPENIYSSISPSLVEDPSMYLQNSILYTQLFGTKNHGCVYKIRKCIHKMREFCINFIYNNDKNRERYSIGRFVLTTPTQHIHYFWGDNN